MHNGVDRAVIAAASPWGDYNDYMLAALRAHPQAPARHRDLQAVRWTLRAGGDGPRRLCRHPAALHRPAKLPDITTFDYRALFRRLADLDWHVHPHVEGDDLPKILPSLEASGVKIVVDHLGRPEPKTGIDSEGFKALLQSIDKGRTWVKVSGGYRLGPQSKDYARELLRVAGPDRLVWASDCPFVGHEGSSLIRPLSTGWSTPFPTPPRATGFLAKRRAGFISEASSPRRIVQGVQIRPQNVISLSKICTFTSCKP